MGMGQVQYYLVDFKAQINKIQDQQDKQIHLEMLLGLVKKITNHQMQI
jgi:hypothetical protein